MNSTIQRSPDPSYRSILLPLDGSTLASGAIPTARALAERFDATLHTVTVAHLGDDVDHLRAHASLVLGVAADDERIHVERDVQVAFGIHRRAAALDACLICTSTHGLGRVAGSIIGSTARDVIALSRSPLVAVGPAVSHADDDGDRAVVPLGAGNLVACVDGTAASELVLPVAAAWSRALDARLTLLTVAEPCPPPVRIGAPWRRHHGPNEDAEAYIRDLAARWALEAPGLDTQVVYDPISAAEGVKDYLRAHPASLIAVASHLRAGLGLLVSGSATANFAHASTAPTLVVPIVA